MLLLGDGRKLIKLSASLSSILEDEHERMLISMLHAGGIMTRKGWLLFIAISVFWGIPYLFIKIAVRELDPTVVVFARVGIAAAVLLPVAAHRKVLRQLRGRWLAVPM